MGYLLDTYTQKHLGKVLPDLAHAWSSVADRMWTEHQLRLRVTSGLRTFADQWDLWGRGRLKDKDGQWIICDIKRVVTYAMPGKSYHQYGLALDSCFMGKDPYLSQMEKSKAADLWNEYGRLCKDEGLEWGGDWKGGKQDRPHCQLTFGLNLHTLQTLYEDGGLGAVWSRCKTLTLCGSEMI